jgi:hypothetical protein
MNVLKLRILVEDQDDFVREIEIKSNQTFKDLHDIIVKSAKFSGNELASFYLSNDEWEKLTEITLIDMSGDVDAELGDEDVVHTIFLMEKTMLDEFLDEPDQKMVYEYDFLHLHTFLIELIDILPENGKSLYPKITLSKGTLNSIDKIVVEKNPDKLKEELLKEFNSMINGDVEEDVLVDDDY